MEVVLRLFRGESLDDVSRELGVELSRLERWRDKGLRGLEEGLREREGDPLQVELDVAKHRIGDLLMEVELLREKARKTPGFLSGRSKR
jgi:hypothetical protein